MLITDLLREAIAGTHARIEDLPLARALVGGWVSRSAYGRLLAQLGLLHDALEARLADCPRLAGLYRPALARAAVVERDLAVLGQPRASRPLDPTARFTGRIEQWAADEPVVLAGCLYVFEGSRMGSMVLVRPLSRALGVPPEPGCGLDYHLEGLAGRPQTWQGFRAALAALPLTENEQAGVIGAARETMLALFDLYREAGADLVPPAAEADAGAVVGAAHPRG